MNIQQLRYVVATAEHGSMTGAARSLYVAQPALSRAVRQLERELDVTIFSRDGRGVALTADGEAFVAGARQALRSLDALRRAFDSPGHSAELVIAASPTLQASMALPILSALQEQQIEVHTRLLGCGSSDQVHDLVTAGRADLGFCDSVVVSELDVVPLGRAEVKLVSPSGLSLPDRITFGDLAGVPLILPTVGSDRRARLDTFFEAVGITPTVAIESDERQVWLEAVLLGLASCLWHSVEALRLPRTGVVVRGFDPPMHQELMAVHRADNDAPAKVLVLDVLRRLGELALNLHGPTPRV